MRAVVTRVASASVKIDGVTVGEIGKGFLILLGVGPGDGEAQCRRLAEKALGLRADAPALQRRRRRNWERRCMSAFSNCAGKRDFRRSTGNLGPTWRWPQSMTGL